MRRRIEQSCDRPALTLHVPAYGDTLPEQCGGWTAPYVTMVNPSGIKGIDVFLGVAERLPGTDFAAVPSWATNVRDLERMASLPNVRVLARSGDVGEVLRSTRTLMVPSLWEEAFGQVVIDAMLRGIPVIASNVGGLPEAKLGLDHLVDVRPIQTYREEFDDLHLPIPVVPEQDLTAWVDPLRALLSGQAAYTDLACRSRAAAADFWRTLTVEPLLRYLSTIAEQQRL
jgi:glycosyltransferase involved in cell wall biosynthesis